MKLPDALVISTAMYDYYGIIEGLVIILLLILVWNFWKAPKCGAALPTYNFIMLKGYYECLTNKPKPLPITSVMLQKMDAIAKQFEKEGMCQVWSLRRVVMIFGEESVRTFANDEASADKSYDYIVINDALGEGLITSNGEAWKKDRKMLNPLFHTGTLKDKMSIFNGNAKDLVKKLAKAVDKPTFDVLPSLKSTVFYNLCESVLDINVKKTVTEKEIEDFFELMAVCGEYMTYSWIFWSKSVPFLKFFTPSGWKFTRSCGKLRRFGQKIVSLINESASFETSESKHDLDENRKSIISIFLDRHLKDPSFTSKSVQDHVCTLAAAGTDTVVHTMMWTLFLLGLNKDIQDNVYEEIQSVKDEFITYENLCQLEYLECVIKETLRLYPTVPVIARYLKKDKQCGKYTVPKDTVILFLLYRLHRNSEIYTDPETFNPDRFSSANEEKKKWAHLPFSEGYRTCIGKKFAMMEMKVTLAYILRNYEVTSLDEREDVDLAWKFILMPMRPLRLRFSLRK